MRRIGVALAAAFGVAVLLAARPAPARAGVIGDCTVTASADSTGPIDVGATDVWHLRSGDSISVSATSGGVQTSATGFVSAFGFDIPLRSGSSNGESSMSTDLADASFLATLGRVFVLSGL